MTKHPKTATSQKNKKERW